MDHIQWIDREIEKRNSDKAAFLANGNTIKESSGQQLDDIYLHLLPGEVLPSGRESDRLLSEMSSEIHDRLINILGYTKLLNMENISENLKLEYTEYIMKSCNHMLRMISDIKDLTGIESGQTDLHLTRINLIELIEDTIISHKPEADSKNVGLYQKKSESQITPFVVSDEAKLGRVLGKLIENSIKFTSNGYIEIGFERKEAFIELYVKDSGTGISQEQLYKLHDLLSRNVQDISGLVGEQLGLTISKYYMNLLNGTIRVNSNPGDGSIFYITVPNITTNSGTDELASDEVLTGARIKTCLLADPLEVNYFYLKALLSNLGIRVLWAKDRYETIIMSINDNVDVIIVDFSSPELSDYETLRIIREKKPEIQIIAQYPQPESKDYNLALQVGYDDLLARPITISEFRMKVCHDLNFEI